MSIISAAAIKMVLDALGIDSTGNLEALLQESAVPQELETEEPIARVALNPGPRGQENEHIKSL